ncbi:MAG: glycosyltransferase [Lysobacterales bacterium]
MSVAGRSRGAALIVLAWNQWPLTRRCLDSLLASELDAAEVIVVDNGSSDETRAELAAYADRVRIVALAENLGFVRGMNAGIAAACADDDVVLLNNDLVFNQVDWLNRLRDAAYAAPEHGVVGCRLLGPQPEGRVYHLGGFIEADELWGQQTESGVVEREVAQFSRTRRVQGIAFALAYLRRDCMERIGTLDTAFHSYFEDTDYCLRAGDAGIASVIAGAVTLRHDQHGSTQDDGGFRQRLWNASRATFATRWQARLRAAYRGNVLWQGTTRSPYAYAQLTRSVLRRLDARGLRMAFAPVEDEVADAQDFRVELAARRRWPPPTDAAVICAPGNHFAAARGRYRLGLGFGEWQRVPPAWVAAANTLDGLLVPDAFQRDAFLEAGVRVPIGLLPLGVDRDYCHVRVPAPRQLRGDFVFLGVVEDLARDAPEVLVAAFRRAFAAGEPVELLIHVRPAADAAAISALLMPLLAAPGSRVRVLDGWAFPWHQRAQLLSAADAYVSVRRGGGWDPLAFEAVACGRVLIAGAFGSQAELARTHGFPVAIARIDDAPGPDRLRWTEPDADAFAAQLRQVFDARVELVAAARARGDRFGAAHDIDATADALVERLADGGTLAAARPTPAPHRPAQLVRPASGQVVVLGMHRSGTSSVAGLLARMGAWAGPESELLQGPDNPKGHYESARLHLACVRRLAAAGGDWKHPPSDAPPAAIDAFRREAGALIDTLDARRPWLIKEPRLCLVARELLPLLTRPVFVHVVRDPCAVAASLAARDGLSRRDAFALWETYTRAAFEMSRGWPRLIVDYAGLLADPVAAARELHGQLCAFGIEGLTAPDAATVRDWIDVPSAPVRAMGDDEPGAAQRALWDAIVDRSILGADPAAATPMPRRAGGA